MPYIILVVCLLVKDILCFFLLFFLFFCFPLFDRAWPGTMQALKKRLSTKTQLAASLMPLIDRSSAYCLLLAFSCSVVWIISKGELLFNVNMRWLSMCLCKAVMLMDLSLGNSSGNFVMSFNRSCSKVKMFPSSSPSIKPLKN